jgi:hypothetical protein
MLSKQAVDEYRRIYKRTFGKEISPEKADEQGTRLFRLFQIIYRPIPSFIPNAQENKD